MRLEALENNFLRSIIPLFLLQQCKISMTRGLQSPLFFLKKMERLRKIVEEVVGSDPTLFVVDFFLKGTSGNQKLLIIIDGDNGVNIDHCSMVSRKVGAILEEEDLISGKYFLEVSSPGLDHPIKLRRQYEKNVGRQLNVEKNDGEIVSGKLLKVESDTLILETSNGEKKERHMNFDEINQSKIEVSFK